MTPPPAETSREHRASDEDYDELRRRVFRAFVITTAVFTSLITVGELFVRGPGAWQFWAFATLGAIFSAVASRARRPGRLGFVTVLCIASYSLVFLLLESVSSVAAVGIRVASFAFPVAVLLLVGRRAAIGFYVFAAVQTLVMFRVDRSDPTFGVAVMHAMGSIFVGGVLLAIAWVFDHARATASARADARERELRVALERAEAAAEARSNFLASMSHEIRTPMNGVLGLSRLLVEEVTVPSQRQLAETVVASGQSLLQILDDILDLSKLDAGALAIDPATEDPAQIVRQAAALQSTRAQDAGLTLTIEVADAVPEFVTFDGHRFRQIVSNLVGNALKFTTVGGVQVRLDHDGVALRCEVEDTGIGIPPEVTPTLFNAFVQADSGTARRFGGTGLGLAICKRLCDLMGGRIGVESVPDQGSRFWFELPAPRAERPSIECDVEPSALSPMRVLVAEDNKVNQLVIRRFLQRLGVDVDVVDDGEQAVQRVGQAAYDLLLMDWHMPNVDGLQATHQIRELPHSARSVPIVALTASVMAGDRAACLEAGMDDVLAKPIDMKQLETTLRRYARA